MLLLGARVRVRLRTLVLVRAFARACIVVRTDPCTDPSLRLQFLNLENRKGGGIFDFEVTERQYKKFEVGNLLRSRTEQRYTEMDKDQQHNLRIAAAKWHDNDFFNGAPLREITTPTQAGNQAGSGGAAIPVAVETTELVGGPTPTVSKSTLPAHSPSAAHLPPSRPSLPAFHSPTRPLAYLSAPTCCK